MSILVRTGVAIIGVGFGLFLIGLFPGALSLNFTLGFGRLQIFAFVIGLSVMVFGAYVYMYATRHRSLAPRLREEVGVRLMATGVVFAWATALADLLGIGSNFGSESPYFGPWQAAGVAFSVLVIVTGIGMYAQRQTMKD